MKTIVWLLLTILIGAIIVLRFGSTGAAFPSVAASNEDFHPPASAIPRTLFGLNVNQAALKKDPWPMVPFGSLRLWDSGTAWSQLNPAKGKYDWQPLDKWF